MTLKRSAAVFASTAVLLPVGASAASTFGGTLDVPTSASVGEKFSATGRAVKPGFTYRLVFDQMTRDKTPGVQCARSIDQPYSVRGTQQPLRFEGRIPTTLACSKGGKRLARTVRVARGTYRWVLASKTGRAAYDPAASIVVKKVTIK